MLESVQDLYLVTLKVRSRNKLGFQNSSVYAISLKIPNFDLHMGKFYTSLIFSIAFKINFECPKNNPLNKYLVFPPRT